MKTLMIALLIILISIQTGYAMQSASAANQSQANYLKFKISVTPEYQKIKKNGNVTFKCDTKNAAYNEILWLKHDSVNMTVDEADDIAADIEYGKIKSHMQHMASLKEHHVNELNMKNKILNLYNVQAADEGWYTCVIFKVQSQGVKSAYLKVIEVLLKPQFNRIEELLKTLVVQEHDTLVLECPAKGNPRPNITWFNNTSQLDCNNNRKLWCKDWKLHVNNFQLSDAGSYKCQLCNSQGCIEHLTEIEFKSQNDTDTDSIRPNRMIIVSISVSFVIVLILVVVAVVILVRKSKRYKLLLRQRFNNVHKWTKVVIVKRLSDLHDSSLGSLITPIVSIQTEKAPDVFPRGEYQEYIFPHDPVWELERRKLRIGTILGEGAFGQVVMAEAEDIPHIMPQVEKEPAIVAIKMVKDEHTDMDVTNLVHEMEVMKIVGKHVNIINFLGCCTTKGPLWVVVEYAPYGNLKEFLKQNYIKHNDYYNSDNIALEKCQVLSQEKMINFSYQIAKGMEYLISKGCIHRDLAARNILVSYNYIMKIADFGLAREVHETDYYRKRANGPLPVKWMSPESLELNIYNAKSDVWAYGILLWEIWSYGCQPYSNLRTCEEVYSFIVRGQRMESPENCLKEIYFLMKNCWLYSAEERPRFSEIVDYLNEVRLNLFPNENDIYLQVLPPLATESDGYI